MAEVHNTPWSERHAYVLDAREQPAWITVFDFDKDFHVSPFLPMDMAYDWRFVLEPDAFSVHMRVTQDGTECFRAGMTLALGPMTRRSMRWMPLKFPLVTLKVMAGIYWQAFRLWTKGIPFHHHPETREKTSMTDAEPDNDTDSDRRSSRLRPLDHALSIAGARPGCSTGMASLWFTTRSARPSLASQVSCRLKYKFTIWDSGV